MKCQRVDPVVKDGRELMPLGEGNYALSLATGEWWFHAPGTKTYASLVGHEVEEHEDGTISVIPSILWPAGVNGVTEEVHGYLTRGEWVGTAAMRHESDQAADAEIDAHNRPA